MYCSDNANFWVLLVSLQCDRLPISPILLNLKDNLDFMQHSQLVRSICLIDCCIVFVINNKVQGGERFYYSFSLWLFMHVNFILHCLCILRDSEAQ